MVPYQGQTRLTNPKETIIAKTQELIQTYSYNSVTFDSIAKELGVKKPSILYHFNSKEELGLEVLKAYRKQIQGEISNLEKYADNPLIKLKSYFRFFVNIYRSVMGLCPAGVMSAEFNALPEAMQHELKLFFLENFTWLTSILEEGRQNNTMKFEGQARDHAYLIASAIQGSILLARMEEGSDILWGVLKLLKEGLNITEEWAITPKDAQGNQIKI